MLEFESLGLDRVQDGAVGPVRGPQPAPDGQQERRRPQVPPDRRGAVRHPFQHAGQRRLPPGPHGALRRSGQDPARRGQPHAGRRRRFDARHRRGRAGRGPCHGRLSLSSSLPQGARREADREAARLGERQGRDPGDAAALRRQGLRRARSSSTTARASGPFPPRTARPSATWAPRPGATTSIFPSDERTREYLEPRAGARSWVPLAADEGAAYDEYAEIDLSKLEPLIAKPSSPGNVVPVREVAGTKVDQVIVGSSVNSSFRDLMVAARMLEGRQVHPDDLLPCEPGQPAGARERVPRQDGLLAFLTVGRARARAGVPGLHRHGPGAGHGRGEPPDLPAEFSRRSGTKDDKVYLCSPETATAAALKGRHHRSPRPGKGDGLSRGSRTRSST